MTAIGGEGGQCTRSALRELVDAWYRDVETVQMAVREHQLIGLTVYGLTAHTHALAKAVLVLDAEDQQAGIVPLVRQAMECGITAVWLELAGYPAVLTLLQEQTRQQRNLIAEFVRSGQVADDTVTERLNADLKAGLVSASTSGARFEARCKEISGGTGIYAMYRALSGTSHASASIVDLYLATSRVDESTRADRTALRVVPSIGNGDATLGVLLSVLVAAGSAWSRLDRRRYMRTRLKELCRELQVAYRHELTAEGLAQTRRREIEYREWRRTHDFVEGQA